MGVVEWRFGFAEMRFVRFQAAFHVFSLKSLQNLQSMERRRLADIFSEPVSNALFNKQFGDEPSPLDIQPCALRCGILFYTQIGDLDKRARLPLRLRQANGLVGVDI